jgi:3-oxoacyl-[acyl-carrier-protein] synthase-3
LFRNKSVRACASLTEELFVPAVGIIGLGTYLPPTVRTNDWWSKQTVARWAERMALQATRAAPITDSMTVGQRLTLQAMGELANDPFRGAVERRVMGSDTTATQMEVRAAREAIERAGVRLDEIDVILSNSPAPDHLMVNSACVAHRDLGLSQRSLALSTDGACNGFAQHMTIAAGMIAGGQARHVLSVHSCALSRVMPSDEPHSAWFGDGAAAVVIGPVSEGKGLLASVHNADGNQYDSLVLGPGPDKRYWEPGPGLTVHSLNRDATRNMLFGMVDRGAAAIHEAMTKANITKSDVDYFATHQSTPWLTRMAAKAAGLEDKKTVVTYPMFGNMSSVNVPMVLAIGEREGMLRDGSTVVTFSGGIGETWTSLVMRWGR